ncbi:hypothetical protein FGE12_20300 [Aggregicoccus sp. 17bor-14]|uniref:hypothetical protein n=1 Tax=Myxococcaceae TaxID=31 RepID=UPI00129C6075|nr:MULTISPECIES: hypothetical protein [Myxococcaceae]MBF5044753.1 hypothetical protein [Simulacricoccus sp. 17bor-14]MRI90498.1 hypothetical protein [Aggregicoccus sp. 17bor-14]
MSEYQWYEFVAVDRPLSEKEQTALRGISTQAEISATRFWNEYQWGDLKADPAKLLAKYFDLHLYFANWGTHRLMLRVPKDRVDLASLKPYFAGAPRELTVHGEHLVIDLRSENDGGDDGEEPPSLATLAPVRALLLQGDLRPAYLAWLCGLQEGEREDDAPEPPVPAGLGKLDGPLEALADFLRIDVDLLAAAAEASPEFDDDEAGLVPWVKALPEAERLRWLLRAAKHPELALGAELRAAYRQTRAPVRSASLRTAAELWKRAEQLRSKREAREAAAQTRSEAAAERRRQKRLEALAERGAEAWAELAQKVDEREYEKAVALASDLHALAERDGKLEAFDARFAQLKKRLARRKGFFDRFKRAMRPSVAEYF